jgi:LCP family protein required for cell wall assembly
MSANDPYSAAEKAGTVAKDRPGGRRKAELGWFAEHRVLIAVLMLATVLLASCGGWAVYLNGKIANVPRVDLNLNEKQRPKHVGDVGAMNILLAGADSGGGPSIAQSVAKGHWDPGSHRSDTIMVLHITADHKKAYLVSVPRDTYVKIDGVGHAKINAAFSDGGPSLYVKTMEEFTGLRMDHLAIIDWAGFKELTTALGGIRVYIPQDVYDTSQRYQWHKGWQTLEGKVALKYVRMRHGLQNGDFDRIKRQQNFLRQTMHKMLSNGTTNNPIRLTRAVEAITRYLTVDSDFTNGQIRDLAMSLRKLDQKDVTFVTVPMLRYGTSPDGQSIVVPDLKQTRALFDAVSHDDIQSYIKKYGKEGVLGRQSTVH